MRNGFAAWVLVALSLTAASPDALAKQEMPIDATGGETVLPEQAEPRSGPELKPAVPAAGSRGELLYENHCQLCHTSVVHVRETRRARTLDELKQWVTRWSVELNLSWGADEIADVVEYLNRRYYKLDLPSGSP